MSKDNKKEFADVDEEEIEAFEAGGNLAPSTIYHRKSNVNKFGRFVEEYAKIGLDLLIDNAKESSKGKEDLQKTLKAFFNSIRVKCKKTGKQIPPHRNTCNGYKTNIRMHILEKTDNAVDITNKVKFAGFLVRNFLS